MFVAGIETYETLSGSRHCMQQDWKMTLLVMSNYLLWFGEQQEQL